MLQKPEGPGGDGTLRCHGLEHRGLLFTQPGQPSAPEGLHDPHGDVVLLQQLHFLLSPLEGPVDIVELELAELHVLPVGLQEALEHRHGPVTGEAQMADAAVSLLLQQVVQNAVLGVQIGVDVHLTHIVEQVKVEVIHPALLQLLFKDLPHLSHVAQIIARELVGQVKCVPWIGGQGLADGQLGIAGVVGPGGVIIIDPPLHGQGYHFLHSGLVHYSVVSVHHGQAHTAQP